MLLQHDHPVDVFDPSRCRVCAREAGLLDHYQRVQDEQTSLRRAEQGAQRARRYALGALWLSGIAVLLALIALLQG